MPSLLEIIYTLKTNETNLEEAKDYIFRQASFRQQAFEDFVNQIKSIQTDKSQQLLNILIENEAHITIIDQFISTDPTHIEALHTTRVPKSRSFTTANQMQQQMDSDSQSTIPDNQMGNQPRQQQPDQQNILTPPNIVTPSQSQSQQQQNRRVNFLPLQHDGIPQQIRDDTPGIDALATLLQSTLQTAIHVKPSAVQAYTPEQVNNMPIKDYVNHLKDHYVTSNKLSERDIYQIRFVIAVYDDRANISDKLYHDCISQVILFYHVLLYGWSVASQKCANIIFKPTLHDMPIDLKEYRKHNGTKPVNKSTTQRARQTPRGRQYHNQQFYNNTARSTSRRRSQHRSNSGPRNANTPARGPSRRRH
jgi:hypothetical protein